MRFAIQSAINLASLLGSVALMFFATMDAFALRMPAMLYEFMGALSCAYLYLETLPEDSTVKSEKDKGGTEDA